MNGSQPPGGEQKLTEEQSAEFRSAAYWMGIRGRLLILFAFLSIISFRIPVIMLGVGFAFLGAWTLNAASAFKRVADYRSGNIQDMLQAVMSLKSLYRFQVILSLILAVLLIIGIFLTVSSGKSFPWRSSRQQMELYGPVPISQSKPIYFCYKEPNH